MRSAVIIFGRMNPPTIGHEMLLRKMQVVAAKKHAEPILFLSSSQDNKKNPLSFEEKAQLIKSGIRGMSIAPKEIRSPYEALSFLFDKGYGDITILVGADRVADFRSMVATWKKTEQHDIPIIVQVINDPTVARDTVSATAARTFARLGDLNKFSRILISGQSPSKVQTIMTKIKTRMGSIAEWIERDAEDLFDFQLLEGDIGSSYVLVLSEADDKKDEKDDKPKKDDKKDNADKKPFPPAKDKKDSKKDSKDDKETPEDKEEAKKDDKKAPPFAKKDAGDETDEKPKERKKTTTDDENVHLNDGPVESDVKGNDAKLVLNPPEKIKKVLADKIAERQKSKSAK